jgi:hypothetical protein
MLSLVGAAGYDRSHYQETLEREVLALERKRSYVADPQQRAHEKAIQETVDELFHRGHWQMAYPFTEGGLEPQLAAMAKEAGVSDVESSNNHEIAELLELVPGLIH